MWARRGPYASATGVGRILSACGSVSRPASLRWLWGGMRTEGIASERFSHRLQRRLCRSGPGVRPELPWMRPSTPAPRRALRGTGEAGDAHLAPRERSHHGRDRSMPSSVSFGASKECGGRKSPTALYRIEHGRNDLDFIISRKQIKSERKLPVGGVEVDHIIPSRGWDMCDQFFRITREGREMRDLCPRIYHQPPIV